MNFKKVSCFRNHQYGHTSINHLVARLTVYHTSAIVLINMRYLGSHNVTFQTACRSNKAKILNLFPFGRPPHVFNRLLIIALSHGYAACLKIRFTLSGNVESTRMQGYFVTRILASYFESVYSSTMSKTI